MTRDPGGELQRVRTTPAGIRAAITRLVERERTRDRAARQKRERRRAAAERARQFERVTLAAILRG